MSKLKKLSTYFVMVLAVIVAFAGTVVFTACGEEPTTPPNDPGLPDETESAPDFTGLSGVNMVLSLNEAEALLAQANTKVTAQSLSPMDSTVTKWTKALCVKVLQQIKDNMAAVSAVQITISNETYFSRGLLLDNEEFFSDDTTYDDEHNIIKYNAHWQVLEDGVMYSYGAFLEKDADGQRLTGGRSPLMTIDPFYKSMTNFLSTTCILFAVDVTEDIIENISVKGGYLYFNLSTSKRDYNGDPMTMNQTFMVNSGKINHTYLYVGIPDRDVPFINSTMKVDFVYNDAVDRSLLNIPTDIDWTINS